MAATPGQRLEDVCPAAWRHDERCTSAMTSYIESVD